MEWSGRSGVALAVFVMLILSPFIRGFGSSPIWGSGLAEMDCRQLSRGILALIRTTPSLGERQ
jgi:hypothetical protein